MSTIPTKEENPKGLHQKYFVAKLIQGIDRSKYALEDTILPVDEGAEYFVLKLNEPFLNQPEYEHRVACRIAVNAYADAIEATIPQLAKDLRERYPVLLSPLSLPAHSQPKVDEGDLAARVLIRATGATYDDKGNVVIPKEDLFAWFKNGDHLKKFTEYDTL